VLEALNLLVELEVVLLVVRRELRELPALRGERGARRSLEVGGRERGRERRLAQAQVPVVVLEQGRAVPKIVSFESEWFKAYEMVIRVIPIDFACSYMRPSTSVDTAEVDSSSTPYVGRW